jgi:hypothetical protein
MAFSTGLLGDPNKVGGGERYDDAMLVLSATTFEDNLKVGRFAKLDTGSIDNFDGSATPVIAGVVLRNVANPVEDAGVIDADLYSQVEYIRQGLVTVEVKSGETPTQFGRVYISNAGDANDGLATATNTDVDANAEFIEEVDTNVWMIYVTPAPGDVATHIAEATGAHAASAISIADAGGFTSNVNVETVTQEMLPATPRIAAIADPGDAGAIPVLRSGNCALTTGAAGETRTIADPGTVGLTLSVSHDVDGGGDAVITVATAFNQTGNNTITMADAGDTVVLTSVQVAGSPVWRLVVNDGAALTTV